MSEAPVITIDGPSGVGKGTISRLVAGELGWSILDSGSLYRLTALAAVRDAVSTSDPVALGNIAAGLDIAFENHGDAGLCILLRGEDVSEAIRQEEISAKASEVAAVPEVRAALLERQRAFATLPGLIADGRDMGTVVFPNACLKIFMTASAEERALRRYNQLREKGIDVNLSSLVAEQTARDERDANRKAAPLKPAEDAVIIDTTEMSIEEVKKRVLDLAAERFGRLREK